jgi:NADH-ubiquinone oxidoreductase chain 5
MAFPLILLGFGSIFIGYLFKDLIIGPGNIFLSQSIVLDFNHYNEAEYLNIVIKLIPLFMSFSGFLCFFVYIYF